MMLAFKASDDSSAQQVVDLGYFESKKMVKPLMILFLVMVVKWFSRN
jgi:hypothetical protein